MRTPLHIVNARRKRLIALVAQHGFLPIQELCSLLGVSKYTVRRELSILFELKRIKHPYDGAISEYKSRFPSFTERLKSSPFAKLKIAATALSLIAPGDTCFFDAGSTVFCIAEAFHAHPVSPLKIVTSSIPVAELLAGVVGVDVILLGGNSRKSLRYWHFQLAFLSAKAMDPYGIWNSQLDIVAQQKFVLQRATKSVFCLDGSKLKCHAPHLLISWDRLDTLITDVPLFHLQHLGIKIRPSHYHLAQ